MKKINNIKSWVTLSGLCAFAMLACCPSHVIAQAKTADTSVASEPVVKKRSYVKNTFEGTYIIDEQSVIVPIKGTFEFDIQHRFGTIANGTTDFFGIFASATMRLGANYVVANNVQLGFGATNERMQVDGTLKWAILKQTKNGSMPVSVSYFGDAAMDTRKADNTTIFVNASDRFSFFNEILIARKFSEKLSLQAGFNVAHFNNLLGYQDASGNVQPILKNDNFGASVSGKYTVTDGMALIATYDQPLTQNPANNPHPNLALGIDMRTSGHDFQIFIGNYSSLIPQNNFVFNQNDFHKRQFLIGFNISRLWNF